MSYQSISKSEFGTRNKRGQGSEGQSDMSEESYAVFVELKPQSGIRIPHDHPSKGPCPMVNRLNVYRTTHDRQEIAMKHDRKTKDLLVFNFEEEE
jgi:hypothetical protein